MPEKPKVEQWMREAATRGLICAECRTRGIPATKKFNWPLCDDCALKISPKAIEDLAEVIASHAPTPAPEPTAKLREIFEMIEAMLCDEELCGHFTAEEIREQCAKGLNLLAAPAAAQGAPDGAKLLLLAIEEIADLAENAVGEDAYEVPEENLMQVWEIARAALQSSPVSRKKD